MAEEKPVIVPVESLDQDPYRGLISYPNPSIESVQTRLGQLHSLGITELEFKGHLKMGRLSILGKGVVGLVFAGYAGEDPVAVKVRRVDSRRATMTHEAAMMKAANQVGVGPECLGASNDVLAMKFVEGHTLPSWIGGLNGRGRRARARAVFKSLFKQCVKLDAYGLDHGELSRAHKNVLVTKADIPWILDFESASLNRRVNNFTSIAQYLFLSGRFARKVQRVMGPVERDELVKYLRLYKAGRTNEAFEAVEKMLRF